MKIRLASLLSSVPQFMTYFGLAMIAILWVGIEHNLQIRREASSRTATQNITNLSRIFEEHVTRLVRETDKTLLLLRAAYLSAPGAFDLRSWVGTSSFRSELAVQYAMIGPDGIMVASNVGPATARIDLSDREHFRVHSERVVDELFISKPLLGRASGKWSVQLTRGMWDADGAFAGVLVASIDPYHLSRFYESVDLGRDGAVTLVGFDGVIRARGGQSSTTDALGRSMKQSDIFRLYQSQPSGVLTGAGIVDGVKRLLSYRVVEGFPLIVIAAMSDAELFASYKGEAVVYRVAGGLLTLLLAAFIVAGIRSKRRLEQTLAALATERDNAQQASRAKSSFLAVMSHEIRTPMNAVLGLTSSLLEGSLSAEQRSTLQTIHDAGDSLLEILNDILDYSKLEAGELSFETISFAPAEIAESVISIIGPRASAKGLALTATHAPDLPPALSGDAGRLRQVLLNLLSNAVKFTQQGRVDIACRLVSTAGGHATLEWVVSDTGIGIAPERIDTLFNDFVQADCSINRRFGGSGLGLSISKRIVQAMGGEISASSTLGKGTAMRVVVRLPVSEQRQPDTASSVTSRAALTAHVATLGRSLRILVADDNATNRLVAARMLAGLDAQVQMASDGAEAVEAASKSEFDAILMDVRMPEMDGLEAARTIRARGQTVPIIAFTANAFADDVEACSRAGMTGFVAKPVRKNALFSALLEALRMPSKAAVIDGATAIAGSDAPPPAPVHVDLGMWQALEAELGPEGMREAAGMFLTETQTRLALLARSSLPADEALIVREAHTIKGTSATFGLAHLSALAKSLESSVRELAPGKYTGVVDELARAFAEGRARLPFSEDRLNMPQTPSSAPQQPPSHLPPPPRRAVA